MYAPLLFKKMLEEKKYIKLFRYGDKEFADLLFLYKNPFIKYRSIDFQPNGNLVKKNRHNIFIHMFQQYVSYQISEEEMQAFLNSCDVHSQIIYVGLLNNSFTLNIKKRDVNNYFPNTIPSYKKFENTFDVNDMNKVKLYNTSRGRIVHILKHKNFVFMTTRNKGIFNKEIYNVIKTLPVESCYMFGVLKDNKFELINFSLDYNQDPIQSSINYLNFRKFLKKNFILLEPSETFSGNIVVDYENRLYQSLR